MQPSVAGCCRFTVSCETVLEPSAPLPKKSNFKNLINFFLFQISRRFGAQMSRKIRGHETILSHNLSLQSEKRGRSRKPTQRRRRRRSVSGWQRPASCGPRLEPPTRSGKVRIDPAEPARRQKSWNSERWNSGKWANAAAGAARESPKHFQGLIL